MKTKGFLLAVIVGLVCVNMMVCYLFFISKRKFAADFESFRIINILLESRLDNIQNKIILEYDLLGTVINPNVLMINADRDTFTLDQLITPEPVLFFKFSTLSCQPCVEKEFENISKYFSDAFNENINIISYNESIRDYIRVARSNNGKRPVWNLMTNSLGNKLYSLDIPYLFVVDTSNKIKNIFIPDEHSPELSDAFYKSFFKSLEQKQYSNNE